MDLSIIIVSWQVRDKLEENLKTLFVSEGSFKFEVFVVDNASNDGSAQMVAKKFPQVKLIASSENLGFAKANNLAIEKAQGDFILLLNPDMILQTDTLDLALKFAKEKSQAVVSGVRLVDKDGKTINHVRRFPRFFDQLMIVLKIPHLFPSILNNYLLPQFDYNKSAPVDSVRGSFFLINRKSFKEISNSKEPYLDERYFVWFEEVDFCRHIYSLGGEVWYNGSATCQDDIGQSFALLKRSKAQAYFKDSMLKYFAKWEKAWQEKILSLAWSFIGLFIR